MATFTKRVGKRGVTWRALVRRKGRTECATFPTRRQAEEWAARIEQEALSSHYGQPIRRSLSDAIERFRLEVAPMRRGYRWETLRLEKFQREWPALCSRQLSSLSLADLAEWRDARLSQVSASSVRRELALLGAVFAACRQWGWISQSPLHGLKKPQSPPPRRRGISQPEIDALVKELPDEPRALLLLGIETGMRAGEMLSLTWDQVDLQRRVVTLLRSKNGDSRQVPLSGVAGAMLQQLAGDRNPPAGNESPLPFPPTSPVFSISSSALDQSFRKARGRAAKSLPSVSSVHFHDTRSEAATRLCKIFSLVEVTAILGQRDPRTLMMYYKPTAEDLAKRM